MAGAEVHRLLLLCPFQAQAAQQLEAALRNPALDGCLLLAKVCFFKDSHNLACAITALDPRVIE